jgi:hypothetical protein
LDPHACAEIAHKYWKTGWNRPTIWPLRPMNWPIFGVFGT